MKISLNIYKQSLKLWSLGLIISFAMLVPCSAFSQDDQQDDQQDEQQAGRTEPAVGRGPWENSAGSGNAATGRRPGAAQRPGSTLADPGGGPGGNPDVEVPFDDNMNLGFLAIGLVFAFWVVKKRMSARTATIKSNK